jgi:solute carrier family 35, member C2
MIKSAAPVFVLLFAFLFGLEKISINLSLSIILICLGVSVMVANEAEFNLTGYLQAQSATIISGFRWSLTQILLQDVSMGMNNPLATNLFLSPIIASSLFIGFLFQEGFFNLINDEQMANRPHAIFIAVTILGAGLIAFMMVNLEFQLIASTNVVTFSVAGIFKEITTISVSVIVFGDKLTGRTGLGLFISLIGIGGRRFFF